MSPNDSASVTESHPVSRATQCHDSS